jgi:hypothetical protein
MPPRANFSPEIRLFAANKIIQSTRDRIQEINDLINDNCHYKFVEPKNFEQFIEDYAALNCMLENAIKVAESIRAEIQLRQ